MNGQRYYTFVRGNVRFLALDSTLMDAKQLAWIATTLQSAREDWKICYFHHPLYSNAERHGASVDLRIQLEPLFLKYGVQVVFSGHDHVYERLKPQKGIVYFVSGAAGQLRPGNMSRSAETAASFDQDQSFMVVEIAGTDLSFQAISRTGKVVDSGRIEKPSTSGGAGSPVGNRGFQATPWVVHRRRDFAWEMNRLALRKGAKPGERAGQSGRRRSRVRAALPALTRVAAQHLLLLPLGALIALVWVNAAPESYYRFTFAIAFAVNDVAMVFFFGLMTKEVVEATAPNGVLHSRRRVLLPVAAAIGATVVPALLFRPARWTSSANRCWSRAGRSRWPSTLRRSTWWPGSSSARTRWSPSCFCWESPATGSASSRWRC